MTGKGGFAVRNDKKREGYEEEVHSGRGREVDGHVLCLTDRSVLVSSNLGYIRVNSMFSIITDWEFTLASVPRRWS